MVVSVSIEEGSTIMIPDKLNKIIHERVRLAIMSALATRDSITFPELRELLGVTDGNLSIHATVLEQHGLIGSEKDFIGRKPRTTYRITPRGRRELMAYIAEMEEIVTRIKSGHPDPVADAPGDERKSSGPSGDTQKRKRSPQSPRAGT